MRMPTAQRRELLLQAAFRVMARDGVAAATTRAVCAEAGMPLASFHYVFESQQALMTELIRVSVKAEAAAVREPETTDDPVHDVEQLLLASFEYVREHPGEELAMLELCMYASRTPGVEELTGARSQITEEMVGMAIDKLAAHHGELLSPREELVQLVLTVVEGNTLVWLWTRDEAAARRRIRVLAELLTWQAWRRS